MTRKYFNKEKFNIERLQPQKEIIEMNNCTHLNLKNNRCEDCGIYLEEEMNLDELVEAGQVITGYLETMKMVANVTLSKKEMKVAQKYFDMLPLLYNLTELYEVCEEEYGNYLKVMNESAKRISKSKVKEEVKETPNCSPDPITPEELVNILYTPKSENDKKEDNNE